MPTLTIRNLDEELKANLRILAATHGRSMEEEARSILRQALIRRPVPAEGLGQRLRARFKGVAAELPIPSRSAPRTAPVWNDPT